VQIIAALRRKIAPEFTQPFQPVIVFFIHELFTDGLHNFLRRVGH
jgi:hypothetical protein